MVSKLFMFLFILGSLKSLFSNSMVLILISLEMMSIFLFFLFCSFSSLSGCQVIVVFLTFMVCESVLGVSILVGASSNLGGSGVSSLKSVLY